MGWFGVGAEVPGVQGARKGGATMTRLGLQERAPPPALPAVQLPLPPQHFPPLPPPCSPHRCCLLIPLHPLLQLLNERVRQLWQPSLGGAVARVARSPAALDAGANRVEDVGSHTTLGLYMNGVTEEKRLALEEPIRR